MTNFGLIAIDWREIITRVTFLFARTTKIAISLLLLQMSAKFMPLVLLSEITFQNDNIFTSLLEGQYIIKNVTIISAALVLGDKLDKGKEKKLYGAKS